jgi:putative MATE family efflux protein
MGSTVIMALFPLLIGIGTGTIAVIARSIGAENQSAADNAATQSVIIALFTALILCVIGLIFSESLLKLLQATPEVARAGEIYLKILLIGGISTTLLFLGSAILQGAGDASTPMIIMVVAIGINIILDPIFIFGLLGFPELRVKGAALATVSAEAIAALAIMYILLKGKSHIHIKFRQFKVRLQTIMQIIKIGIPSSIQMLSRNLMNMVLIAVVASFGTAAVAAYGVGMRLRLIVLLPAFAFGTSSATLVGQNLGADRPNRAKKCAWMATALNAGIMFVIGVLSFVFARQIITLFNSNPEVVNTGTSYLKITSLFFPLLALGVVLGRSLSGAGDTVPPMVITIISLWVIQIPLALLLSKITSLGVNGIWWAIVIASCVNGLLNMFWFQKDHWKDKEIKM